MQMLLQQKIMAYFIKNSYVTLTIDVVSFAQPGPGLTCHQNRFHCFNEFNDLG